MIWGRAEGCRVWDDAGREYLDLSGGFGVAALGHRNPRIQEAIDRQQVVHALGDLAEAEVTQELRRRLPRPAKLGVTGEDAVEIARAYAAAGADAIDVSTGQVTPDEQPAFGRSYQTPYADAIRNRAGIATIAVGVISSFDDVNSLILAGRADLCALGRAHLYDPNWTLHAAASQGYSGRGANWPDQWAAGGRAPQTGRTDGPKPRLALIREASAGTGGTRHARWRPASAHSLTEANT